MYPPAFITLRQALNDFKIPGSKHVIEKGQMIWIPNMCIHRDERYWKNPERFDPERFTAEEIAKRPNLSYMPFGEGPRNCIGMRFALINFKFGLATIIKNFKVELDTSKTKIPFKYNPKSPALAPTDGFWIKFAKVN